MIDVLAESSLSIAKLSLECDVPEADAGESQRISQRLKAIAKRELGTALAQALGPLDNNATDSTTSMVVIIKELQLDFDLDLQLHSSQIANFWAEKLKNTLVQKLSSSRARNIVSYASPAHQLAAFLQDLILGSAWQRWYHKSFLGLKALSFSACMRTAIMEYPERGMQALALLEVHILLKSCGELTNSDAKQIVRALDNLPQLEGFSTDNLEKRFKPWLALSVQASKQSLAHGLIVSVSLMARESRLKNGSAPIKYISSILCFGLLFDRAQRGGETSEIKGLLLKKQITQLQKYLSLDFLPILQELIQLPENELSARLEVFHSIDNAKSEEVKTRHQSQTRFSYFGSSLFILQQLHRLPLARILVGWPGWKTFSALQMFSLLVIQQCQGRHKATAEKDSLLAELCGLKDVPAQVESLSWLQGLDGKLLQSSRENYIDFICSEAEACPKLERKPRRQFILNPSDEKISVFDEPSKGQWLGIYREGEKVPKQLSSLSGTMDGSLSQEEQARNLKKVEADYAYFFPNEDLMPAETFVSLVAQGCLKSIAWRLPGFAHSSCEYLMNNFLSMSLSLVEEEEKYIAHISKVPMNIILNMTGLNRSQLHFPHFSEKKITIQETA